MVVSCGPIESQPECRTGAVTVGALFLRYSWADYYPTVRPGHRRITLRPTASMAAYRENVLTEFQQVEDNLTVVRILENEATVQM